MKLKFSADKVVPIVIILGLLAFMVPAFWHMSSYDPLDDPRHTGMIECTPIAELAENYCEQDNEDIRCYSGQFLLMRHHDSDGVIFYNQQRQRVQISNVSCRVVYDQPKD